MKRITYLVLFTLLISVKSFGQFSLNVEIRPRFEFRDGFRDLPSITTTPAYLVTQRSRLFINYSNNNITTKITFQDVRIWGSEKLKTNIASTALHEGWVQLKIYDSLKVRIGRQEIAYDNERLLAKNYWTQQGLCHDALVFLYHNNDFCIDFGSAFNQVKDTTFGTDYSSSSVKGNYKTLNYLWINKKIEKFTISLLGIMDGFQKSGAVNSDAIYLRGTYGAMIYYRIDKLLIAARGFMQTGTTTTGTDINPAYKNKKMNINAHYMNVDISYAFTHKFSIQAGFEDLSGQNNKNLNTYTAFSTLYGTNHKFNGNMEYFIGAPNGSRFAGLINPYLEFMYQLNDKLGLRADFHYFALDNNYFYDSKGNQQRSNGKYLGNECDLSCNYDVSKEVNLLIGYSCMLPDKDLTNIVTGSYKRVGNWAFVQLTVKPTFFKTDKF